MSFIDASGAVVVGVAIDPTKTSINTHIPSEWIKTPEDKKLYNYFVNLVEQLKVMETKVNSLP